MKEHPITPPPKLLDKWRAEWAANDKVTGPQVEYVATQAARRPKPPSLKEQALDELDRIQTHDENGQEIVDLSVIRRALEALPD